MKEVKGRQAERRRDILASAQRVFAAKGYAAASVDEIALAAGVAKGSIYNYFRGKEDLFAQLFAEEMAQMRNQITQVMDKDISVQEKLGRLLDMGFDRVVTDDKQLCQLALEFWVGAVRQGRAGPLMEIFSELYDWYHGVLVGLLRLGQQRGEFELKYDVDVSATLMMAVLDGLWLQSLLGVVSVGRGHIETLKLAVFASLAKEVGR
jgi:AcrR family transcriptional regulator